MEGSTSGTKWSTENAPSEIAAERPAKRQVTDAGGRLVYIHALKSVIRDAESVKPGNESRTRDIKH